MDKKEFEILAQIDEHTLSTLLTDRAYCAFLLLKNSSEITHCTYELIGDIVRGHVSGGQWFSVLPIYKMGFMENGNYCGYSSIKKYFE